MKASISNERMSQIRNSLLNLCLDSGILMVENNKEVFHYNLIESGMVDSLGVVCLQDQIETHYQVEISPEQFVAELHTLDKLAYFLAENSPLPVPA